MKLYAHPLGIIIHAHSSSVSLRQAPQKALKTCGHVIDMTDRGQNWRLLAALLPAHQLRQLSAERSLV